MSKPIYTGEGHPPTPQKPGIGLAKPPLFFKLLIVILIQILLLLLLVQQAHAQCSMFCKAFLNVALDADCETEITYDMILTDPYNPMVCAPNSPPSFQVIVMDAQNQVLPYSPHINANQIGQSLMVKVRHLPSGNGCWGQIKVRDNLPPTLVCPPTTAIACSQTADTSLTGYPVVSDCSAFDVQFTDQVQYFPCQINIARIHRTWTATDDFGQQSQCLQQIYIKRPELDSVGFPPNLDGIQSPAIPCDSLAINSDLTDPAFSGFPTIKGIPLVNGGTCTLGFSYEDETFPFCENTFKISRKWTIIDWCTNQFTTHYQIIIVEDKNPPTFMLADTLFAGTTSSTACLANVQFPPVQASDNCSSNLTVRIQTPYGVLHQNGGTISGFPEGSYVVSYVVKDDCNNETRKDQILVVRDQTPPTGICRTASNVGLGTNGSSLVPAISFDEGSYDNCCLGGFEVKRANDPDSNYAPEILLDCRDQQGIVPLTVKIFDCTGNENYCSVNVTLKEALAPKITCPSNKILTCFEDFLDLGLTGLASASDNCGIDSTWFVDDAQVDHCNLGTVLRSWKTVDFAGNSKSCIQTINMEIAGGITVDFPRDILLFECGMTSNLLHPDTLRSRPVISGQTCSTIGKNYKDEVFQTQSSGCYFLLRTWKVVDWCTYEASQETDGWYESVQQIDIMDTIAPVLSCTDTFEIALMGNQCFDTLSIPRPVVSDNCASQIDLSLSGDLGNSWFVHQVAPGTYTVQIEANDRCGNTSFCSMVIKARDAKPPVAYCNPGLIVDIPVDQFLDIPAADFDAGSYDNCSSSNLQYEIERYSGSINGHPGTSYLSVDCNDVGLGPISVALWIGDASGNWSSCVTSITVQDNFQNCPGGGQKFSLGGKVEKLDGSGLENVKVRIVQNGQNQVLVNGNPSGVFELNQVAAGMDYEIIPERTDNFLEGVSTMDLVLLERHYFGYTPFTQPEQFISGDINNDQIIDSTDIVLLRRCLLRMLPGFPNNTSWRFVPQNHVFHDPNPLPDGYPETLEVLFLNRDENALNFAGIKIGDIDGSHGNHFQSNNPSRNQLQMLFSESENDRLKLQLSEDADLWGFQLDLVFDDKNATNFSIKNIGLDQRFLSWHQEGGLLKIFYAAPYPVHISKDERLLELKGLKSILKMENSLVSGALEPVETIQTSSNQGKSPTIHFYPNPTKDWVVIETEISPEQMIQVYDTKGNQVKNQRVQSVNKQSFRVDLSGLPTGQYFIGWKEMDVESMIAVLKR
jgi:hypothetical protein